MNGQGGKDDDVVDLDTSGCGRRGRCTLRIKAVISVSGDRGFQLNCDIGSLRLDKVQSVRHAHRG